MLNKICTADEAVALIPDEAVLTPTGFIRSMAPEELINAIEKRFLATGHPKNLTLVHGAAASEHFVGGDAGLNKLAHEGLLARAFSGFYGHNDRLKEMIRSGKIEAYNFPLGVIPHLLREYARGHGGELTKLGLHTYVDPRVEGGRWNTDTPTTGEWVKVVEFMGEEYLYFTTPKPNFAILRGTTADEFGNITMEDEALYSLAKVAAMAVKLNGGTVVFQVKNIVRGGTLDSQQVAIPGILVDKVVQCTDIEKLHRQTAGCVSSSVNAGHLKSAVPPAAPLPLDARKIMARRAAMELMPEAIVNLGTGNPEFVSNVASEEGFLDHLSLTVESGAIGGNPLPGDDFGATPNCWAMLEEDRMFDLYDGGALDIAFLGLAETDPTGNVNVSKFKGTIMGCGGFIEITQATPRVIFVGTFTAGGLKLHCEDGRLVIDQEGKHRKFLNQVEQITFSSQFAVEHRQYVLFVTERAVFRLTPEGLELTEIAPGIDLEKDILALMEFRPIMKDVRQMDARIFRPELAGLKDYVLAKPAAAKAAR